MTRWASRDAAYYLHLKPKRKTPVAYSTVSTSRLLGLLAEGNPGATIAQLREMVTYDPDAIAVCDVYIERGEADVVPSWRY